ncbi:sugar ABC transporter substrate-binding protein [Pseudacidovorax intermedius]|uniref:Periplasmic binding protein domain-containing protein n=1 Tax=Pseudacidovorax intermedius TaxID=433924 RepID=A0A147H6Q0_9BURK|nr:sugar ABC transporter substrate-binding protein [Pseudacidovorax intermedius]KTT25625.1 hypothetical protein NS331_04695 [Pseudacidovorax intermedius]
MSLFTRHGGAFLSASLIALFAAALPASAKSSKDNLKVGVIAFTYSSPAVQAMADAAMADCKQRGWTCELFDGKGDPVATSNAGVNFVNRKFDAVVNAVSDNNQLGTVIKAANAAGIPYVSIFSGDAPGITADIGSSGVVQGALIGGEVRSAIGLEGQVAVVNWNVLPVLRERSRGLKATMADDKNIKIVEVEVKVPGYVEDAYSKLLTLLQSNKNVKAVVVGWNELAPAAVRAIEQLGLKDKVRVYGYDAIAPAFELMRKGSPLAMVVGFSNDEAGRSAMRTVAETVDGRPTPFKALMLRSCLFTRDNMPAPGQEPNYETCTPFTAELRRK